MALALALAVVTAAGFAEDTNGAPGYGPGYGMGPGMMGGYGPGYGMMGGYGPGYGMMRGYGMGPGMMGGYGPGYGMMGGYYGMGPGMMGWGYGMMGPGMMGGYGMGWGMMGGAGLYGIDLSSAQRDKINKILDAERKQHWAAMSAMMEARIKMRDLYDVDRPDPKKIGAAYADIAKLNQQLLESSVRSGNEIRNVLTKEQREQLRQWRHGGWGWGPRGSASDRPIGPGHMGGMMGR